MKNMKTAAMVSLLAVIMAFVVVADGSVDADTTITLDGLTFDLDTSTGEATLTGASADVVDVDASQFVYGGVSYTVTSVAYMAFYSNTAVASAYLPDVESIGSKAFANCTSLTDLDFGDSERPLAIGRYAFYKAAIDGIVLPAGTVSLSACAFIHTSPSCVSVPSSVSTIGSKAFYGMDFVDTDGTTAISATVANLSGYDFVLVGDSLVRLMSKGSTFSSDDCTYKVTDSSVEGVYADLVGYDGASSSFSVPETVSCGGVPVKITGVGSKAFYCDSGITSISIPYVQKIGTKAFAKSGLTSIEMGDSIASIASYAFFACPLTSIEIPAGDVTVGASAFSSCKSLVSISIPGTGSTFGTNAFYGIKFYDTDGTTPISISSSEFQASEYSGTATKMVKVSPLEVGTEFDSGSLKYCVTKLDSSPKAKVVGMADGSTESAVVVPSSVTYEGVSFSVTSIDSRAFYHCDTISSIDTGAVTSIGSKAFASSALTDVVFGDELRTIGTYAFYRCPVTDVTIPAGISTIGGYAFYGCKSITHLDIQGTGCTFGSKVFVGLTFYERDGTTVITTDSSDFQGHSYSGSGSVLIMESDINVGDVFSYSGLDYTITSLEDGAYAVEVSGFSEGSNLTGVVVPASVVYEDETFNVTAIGAKAFYRNTQIVSLEIPDCVTEIGNKAFVSCSSLGTVDLGDGTLHIGVDAFTVSNNVKSISFPSSLTLGSRALKPFSFFAHDGSSIAATAGNLAGNSFEGSSSSALYIDVLEVSFLFCDNFENDGLVGNSTFPTDSTTVNPGVWVHGAGTTFQEALYDACTMFGIQVTFDNSGEILSIDDVVDGNIFVQKWDSSSSEWVDSENGSYLTLSGLDETVTDVAIVHGGASDLGAAPTPRLTPNERTWYFGDDITHYTDGTEVLFYIGDNYVYSNLESNNGSTVDPCTLLVDGIWIRGYADEGARSALAFVDALDALGYSYEIEFNEDYDPDSGELDYTGWINTINELEDGNWLQAVWYPDIEAWEQKGDNWLGKTLVSEGLVMCIIHGAWGGESGAGDPPYPEVSPNDMTWAY